MLFVALFTAVLFFASCDQPTDSKNGGGSGGGGGADGDPGGEKKGPDACSKALGINCSRFEEAYVKASNTDVFDYFGSSVALSGDTLAVGTYGEGSSATGIDNNQTDNSARKSGAVYIFTRSGSTWSRQAYIKASNPDEDDRFGKSIALSGDTLAVGAYWEDSNAAGVNAALTGGSGTQADNSVSNSGAVYVFTRTGSTWSQQAYIKASNPDEDDRFGKSIALSGGTLAVGAFRENSGAAGINGNQNDNTKEDSGAVYIFTGSGSTWSQQAYIKASNPDKRDPIRGYGDEFGWSVALLGDTPAVGARGEDGGTAGVNGNQNDKSKRDSGAVYLFTRSGTTWNWRAYIKASNAGGGTDDSGRFFGDQFGYSLALSGDTLVVGAPFEWSNAKNVNGDQNDNSMLGTGAVYLFTRSGGSWSQKAYIKASNPDGADGVGASAALAGNTLAVGATGESSNAPGVNGNQADNSISGGTGAVYVRRIAP